MNRTSSHLHTKTFLLVVPWSPTTIGGVTAGLVVLGSQLAGMIYSDPGVTRVMLVTALSLLFTPLNAMSLMWQRREMRYGVLLRATLVGAVCQTCVTTGLALLGYGYMSLACGSVANPFGSVLVNLRFWPRQFGYLPSWRAWRPIMSFGISSTLGSLGQEITPRAGDLFVGRLTGVAALGQFSRANSLIGFVNDVLGTVDQVTEDGERSWAVTLIVLEEDLE